MSVFPGDASTLGEVYVVVAVDEDSGIRDQIRVWAAVLEELLYFNSAALSLEALKLVLKLLLV